MTATAQQVPIPRVEQMPSMPAPYVMRDWAAVARNYDAFVFDETQTGEYLPLIWRVTNTVNYPSHDSFGLTTVVGSTRDRFAEAINVLPAVVGATLVGIDKSDQQGDDWVLMTEEFFNRRPEENVYLNHPVTQSGQDWWYETMPNVFFYQLYDLYPETGDFEHQFVTVADRWLAAVQAMGGSATPWSVPFMNYRAFSLSTMTPRRSGVPEPEAAGALAWILYNAYVETGHERYRIGAEWAMEYLVGRTSNPSYELQLPYGVYAAARMNAELGTTYDIEKLLNWCFEVGPLRSWGAILGTWGGYDVHGLIGEVSFNSYAFLMNGFQQAAALVPMTRYDDRFARALGKWVLNLANASRLFYPNALPPEHQDSEAWSFEHDPQATIAHEALRQEHRGFSPFATGDAVSGGWGRTNLTLYSSSHVGYLGGLLDTTNVEGILRLDLLKTDFFGDEAYPTSLYYNPHPTEATLHIDVGDAPRDLYDAVANRFVARGAVGIAEVPIPADAALQLVLAPAGGTPTTDRGRLLIDGVVVDYRAAGPGGNRPPRIKALAADTTTVFHTDSVRVYCTAEDPEGTALRYQWTTTSGQVAGAGPQVTWRPETAGTQQIACRATDAEDASIKDTLSVTVTTNRPPVIDSLTSTRTTLDVGEATDLRCAAHDPDGDPLSYTWSATAGTFSGDGAEVTWSAPDTVGYYAVACSLQDPLGAMADATVHIVAGRQIAYYPLEGDATDESGFDNHGSVHGATPSAGLTADGGQALRFDGTDDVVLIPAHPTLNATEALTVTLWMQATPVAREAFIISHGSWQNRWKVSITPEQRLRWTVKTSAATIDLDAEREVEPETTTFVAATFGDGALRLYVDGILEAESPVEGDLQTTQLDLTLGQMVPGDAQYNFSGVLDEVRLFNRSLPADEIHALFTDRSTAADPPATQQDALHANWPNPVRRSTTLAFSLAAQSDVTIDVYNVLGQRVRRLVEGQPYEAGRHTLRFTVESLAPGVYFYHLRTARWRATRTLTVLP